MFIRAAWEGPSQSRQFENNRNTDVNSDKAFTSFGCFSADETQSVAFAQNCADCVSFDVDPFGED